MEAVAGAQQWVGHEFLDPFYFSTVSVSNQRHIFPMNLPRFDSCIPKELKYEA